MSDHSNMAAVEALKSRKSIRAYQDTLVAPEILREILTLAGRSPSGTNIQPWQVIALSGKPLRELGQLLHDKYLSGEHDKAEYSYYPSEWREPYLTRRRKVGWDLYHALGIERGEKEKMARQHAKNFTFFNAPVGLLFTMDRSMQIGSWLDLGMFMQSIMVAARVFGLDTCPQAAFSDFHAIISEKLEIPEDRQLVCGMALGYRDAGAPENCFETERENIDVFTRFIS